MLRAPQDRLIAVEYSPRAKEQKKKGSGGMTAPLLDGCIGETSRLAIDKALSGRSQRQLIPVRFPLVCPNSSGGLFSGSLYRGNPLETLWEEGIFLEARSLYPVKRPPVSLFTRRRLSPEETPSVPLGASWYLATNSLNTFLGALRSLGKVHSRGYFWRTEWHPDQWKNGGVGVPVFIEGRFYGCDTVVSVYDKHDFGGVVIEAIVRDMGYATFRSNTYVCSNYEEYISYIDGVPLSRQMVPSPWQTAIASLFMNGRVQTPRNYLAAGLRPKVPEDEKSLAAGKAAVMERAPVNTGSGD